MSGHTIATLFCKWDSHKAMKAIRESLEDQPATIIGTSIHKKSVFVMLDESHIAMHNVLGRVFLDVFTCGETDSRQVAVEILRKMEVVDYSIDTVSRCL